VEDTSPGILKQKHMVLWRFSKKRRKNASRSRAEEDTTREFKAVRWRPPRRRRRVLKVLHGLVTMICPDSEVRSLPSLSKNRGGTVASQLFTVLSA
jgi:hypothetical protein